MTPTVPMGRKLIIGMKATFGFERSQNQEAKARLLLTKYPSSKQRFKMLNREKEEGQAGTGHTRAGFN